MAHPVSQIQPFGDCELYGMKLPFDFFFFFMHKKGSTHMLSEDTKKHQGLVLPCQYKPIYFVVPGWGAQEMNLAQRTLTNTVHPPMAFDVPICRASANDPERNSALWVFFFS